MARPPGGKGTDPGGGGVPRQVTVKFPKGYDPVTRTFARDRAAGKAGGSGRDIVWQGEPKKAVPSIYAEGRAAKAGKGKGRKPPRGSAAKTAKTVKRKSLAQRIGSALGSGVRKAVGKGKARAKGNRVGPGLAIGDRLTRPQKENAQPSISSRLS